MACGEQIRTAAGVIKQTGKPKIIKLKMNYKTLKYLALGCILPIMIYEHTTRLGYLFDFFESGSNWKASDFGYLNDDGNRKRQKQGNGMDVDISLYCVYVL
jgi:hypothetical protein